MNDEYKYVQIRGRGKFVDRHGNAYNPIKKNQTASIHINRDGYPCFGGGIPIHLYVAHGWVDGYFEGAEVHHIDSNRMNYDYTNLMWISHRDNVAEASAIGNMSKPGEKNPRAVETAETVAKIRGMYDSGFKVSDIIKELRPDIVRSDSLDEYKRVHKRFNRIAKRETWL